MNDLKLKMKMADWAVDLVLGTGHSGALVIIVKRKTSFAVLGRISDKIAAR